MAKLSELVDDLTGTLNAPGGHSPGPRTQGDPYLQTVGAGSGPQGTTFAPPPAPQRKPAGPVSPFPPPSSSGLSTVSPYTQPPSQLAMAPPSMAQSRMAPPMDAGASVQQAMMQQALESNVMRPPYTQPYSPMAYATQAGFQGAPVSALQVPGWSSADGCGLQGPPPRMSPAAQMQMLQQQKLAQIQAQQQMAAAQAASAKAGQQCLQKAKKPSKLKAMMAGEGSDKGMWTALIILIVILLLAILGLGIGFGVKTSQNGRQLQMIESALSASAGV